MTDYMKVMLLQSWTLQSSIVIADLCIPFVKSRNACAKLSDTITFVGTMEASCIQSHSHTTNGFFFNKLASRRSSVKMVVARGRAEGRDLRSLRGAWRKICGPAGGPWPSEGRDLRAVQGAGWRAWRKILLARMGEHHLDQRRSKY